MPLRSLLIGWALVITCSAAQAADRDLMSRGPTLNEPPSSRWSSVAADPPASPVDVGDRAPRFSYLDPEGEWNEVDELFSEGPVLLVFGASDDEMSALDRSRTRFLDLGVRPALVVDLRAGAASRLARRLHLTSPIIRDPVRAIAELYGSIDPASLRPAPGYFLVDDQGKVRLVGRGSLPPLEHILETTARALGRPTPGSAWMPKS